jgi:Nucleotidyl transferase AbiEii toxin, Type IV TA system
MLDLMNLPELEQFRLVGGTALSLLLGHRNSIDLDLFTDTPFDREIIIDKLRDTYPSLSFQEIKSQRLFFALINNVKVDFVNTFEKFNNEYDLIENIRFASVDSFDQMLNFYQVKYPKNSPMMVLKSATYFADADLQPDPNCFRNLSWENIKEHITEEINIYINTKS